MRSHICVALLALGVLAGCETSTETPPMGSSAAPPVGAPVPQDQMAAFCRGEASAEFDQRPQDLLTLPVEQTGGEYLVYGQWPNGGDAEGTFTCRFDASGVYQGVSRT